MPVNETTTEMCTMCGHHTHSFMWLERIISTGLNGVFGGLSRVVRA